MTFAPGETIGPYRIIEQIGQGGMATVFKAYHAALDRFVALKVLHPAFNEDPDFLARFHREARIVAKLDHPNIIPIYDSAENAGTPYLVIRFVEGKTPKPLLREGPLPLDQVLALMRPISAALAYAHSQGVVHRDIKPSNIIIGVDGRTYLADFGLARMMLVAPSSTSQEVMIGTPQYISPEQAKGEPVNPQSDIYSLGVVLFEMLTGRVPFDANTPYAVIHDHIYTPLPLPSSINPTISPAMELVLLKALAKDPAARYADANELMSAIERAVDVPSATLRPATSPPTLPPAMRLRPQTAHAIPLRLIVPILGGLVFLGIVIAAVTQGGISRAAAGLAPTETAPGASALAPATSLPQLTVHSVVTDLPLPSIPPAGKTQTTVQASLSSPAPTAAMPSPAVQPLVAQPTVAGTPTASLQNEVPPLSQVSPTSTPTAQTGMVIIAAGPFWMGASPADGQAAANEKPAHLVEESAFFIDQFEVTNAAYAQCVSAGVCLAPKGVYSLQSPGLAFGNPALADLPVVFVTQGMASQYCIWEGRRLPLEAEWEKAARGSADQRIYPWGNTWEGEKANAAQQNPRLVPATAYSQVGCSPFGACNMAGNAAEWIADYYGTNFYADSIRAVFAPNVIHDPVNWDSGSGRFVIRGGSFKSNPFDVRISRRDARSGADVVDDVGFRCAKSAPTP